MGCASFFRSLCTGSVSALAGLGPTEQSPAGIASTWWAMLRCCHLWSLLEALEHQSQQGSGHLLLCLQQYKQKIRHKVLAIQPAEHCQHSHHNHLLVGMRGCSGVWSAPYTSAKALLKVCKSQSLWQCFASARIGLLTLTWGLQEILSLDLSDHSESCFQDTCSQHLG